MSDFETEITTTKIGCFNLKSRYSLGRKVKKTTEAIKELRDERCKFEKIANPPPPAASVPTTLGAYSEFESRKDIEEGVMASLRDNEAYKVGICGMGGVGKTTMTKKIMDRAREEHLFEEILMVVISQKVCQEAFQEAEMLRIQDDVALSLGYQDLPKGSVFSRAHALRMRLTAGTKGRLVVLDDIWGNLNLEELGIPCNSRCKVLLTSRDTNVFKKMNVEKFHVVPILSETEAWDLFTSHVGSCIERQDLKSIAQEVIAECKGLPVALVTVGAALKGEENAGIWKDWLHQLKSNNPIGLPDILNDVYKPLRLSYELLKNEEVKSLFLLCCLYPEDGNIPLFELAFYAMGLHMLRGIKSLQQARNRVHSLVQMLKSRFLLLEGERKDHVKMHDVIRDVAIFIADEKKLIACDSNTNDCTWISPYIGKRMDLHDGSIVFPNLHLLRIDRGSRDKELEIDNQFFEGMKELNVFSITCPSLQQLPQKTRILSNLKSLVLEWCRSLENISIVGELVNLEILICRGCKSIECLPTEIGRLRRLKLLELSMCFKMKTIAPGIISNLKELEELIIEHCFDGWEAEIGGEEGKNASLKELEQLSSLSRLKITIKDPRLASQQMRLPSNIVRYHIQIGSQIDMFVRTGPNSTVRLDESGRAWPHGIGIVGEKIMELNLPRNTSLGNWIDERVRRAETMHLSGDVSNLDFGAAQNIKLLHLRGCSTVKKLVSMKATNPIFPLLEILTLQALSELKEICDIDGPIPSNFLSNLKELRLQDLPALEHLNVVSNFNNLSSIFVGRCDRLQSLFSSSMMTSAPPLVQLKSLDIVRCDMMEHVFVWNHEENHIPLVFPKLESLKLHSLPRLTSFCRGFKSVEFSVLEELEIMHCPLKKFSCSSSSIEDDDVVHILCKHDKIKFDCLSKLKFHHKSDAFGRIWCPQIPLNLFFPRLRELQLSGMNGLKSLFSLSTIESDCLSQLERLEISNCDTMEEVILWDEKETNNRIAVFPKLKVLKLDKLPRLTSFSRGFESIEFPMLEEMLVEDCPTKRFVSLGSSNRCPNHHDDDAIHLFCKSDKIKFDCLSKLKFHQSDDMGRIWCPQNALNFFFHRLRELQVCGLNGLKRLFSLSTTESNCLSQLHTLDISNCDMLEEVILWNEECNNCITLFPKLRSLKLNNLPRLMSFSRGIESIEFPLLKEMQVQDCLMRTFVSIDSSTRCPNRDDDAIHLFCQSDKLKIDNLSKLELRMWRYQNDDMRTWCPRIPHDFFARLSQLKIYGFNSMKSLFSSSTIKSGCFSQLEELVIWGCEMMEEVILWNEEENPTDVRITQFQKLKILTLYYLPKLTSLSKGIQFTPPAEMNIRDCPLLESCASTTSSDDYIHLFCKTDKVGFDSLEKLYIGGYDSTSINWCPQLPMIDIFSRLTELQIACIQGRKSLFSYSVARSLHNMKCFYISECKEMVRVIEDEACGGETPPIHLFPHLKELYLFYLPKLKSFCEWRCPLEFPLLTNLRIFGCGVMEKFTSGPLRAPILEIIFIDQDWSFVINDLNALLQQHRLKREEEQKRQLEGCSVEMEEEGGD